MLETIFLFFATLLAYTVKGVTGFGNTLVIDSLFSFTESNKLITPIDLLFSLPTNSYIAWRERKHITIKTVLPLAVLIVLGDIPGVLFLKIADDSLLKVVCGAVILIMAVEILLRKPGNFKKSSNKLVLFLIGVLSGVFSGLFGIGAFVVTYINRTTDDPSKFRADICFVFLADNVFRLILYCVLGIFTMRAFTLALELAPAVILGMFIGMKLFRRLNGKIITRIVGVLLLVSGTLLVLENLVF